MTQWGLALVTGNIYEGTHSRLCTYFPEVWIKSITFYSLNYKGKVKASLPLLCSKQVFISLQISLSYSRTQVLLQFYRKTCCERLLNVYKIFYCLMALTYSWNHPAAHKDKANLLCCINRQRFALCKQHTFNDFQGWEFPTTELYAEVLQKMHLSWSISKQREGCKRSERWRRNWRVGEWWRQKGINEECKTAKNKCYEKVFPASEQNKFQSSPNGCFTHPECAKRKKETQRI